MLKPKIRFQEFPILSNSDDDEDDGCDDDGCEYNLLLFLLFSPASYVLLFLAGDGISASIREPAAKCCLIGYCIHSHSYSHSYTDSAQTHIFLIHFHLQSHREKGINGRLLMT